MYRAGQDASGTMQLPNASSSAISVSGAYSSQNQPQMGVDEFGAQMGSVGIANMGQGDADDYDMILNAEVDMSGQFSPPHD